MRRRIGHIFCLFIMSVAVITSGCGKTTPGTTTKTTAAELPQRSNGSASASWVFSFENLTDLCAYSDVVATGVIDRMVDTTPGDGGNLVSTKWAFRI